MTSPKICQRCLVDKEAALFAPGRNTCKVCRNIQGRSSNRKCYEKHRDARRASKAAYQRANRDKINSRGRARRARDIEFKLADALRTRTRIAIRNGQRSGSAVRDLGCTISELKTYLEARFKPGMTWESWSLHGWHIDHIKPLVEFDLSDRQQFLQACHYTNLQPLWAEENLAKRSKSVGCE
jgi:hypothetical protein